jgi:hypothetical protein
LIFGIKRKEFPELLKFKFVKIQLEMKKFSLFLGELSLKSQVNTPGIKKRVDCCLPELSRNFDMVWTAG